MYENLRFVLRGYILLNTKLDNLFLELAQKRVEIKNEVQISKEYMLLVNFTKDKCRVIFQDLKVNFLSQLDREQVQKANSSGIKNYIEIQHAEYVNEICHTYAVVDKIKIKKNRNLFKLN